MRKLLVLAACLAAGVTHAATFTKLAVTFQLPDGWVEVPATKLQQLHDDMQRQAPNDAATKYDYAFQGNAGPPWLTYPYLLVKMSSAGRPTEQELEGLPAAAAKDGAPGPMHYDAATNIVWMRSKTPIANVGDVGSLSAFIPTERGFVDVHAYALEADFPRLQPVFEKIVADAVIAPELKYRSHAAGDGDNVPAAAYGRLGYLLAIGALAAILFVVFRRRKT